MVRWPAWRAVLAVTGALLFSAPGCVSAGAPAGFTRAAEPEQARSVGLHALAPCALQREPKLLAALFEASPADSFGIQLVVPQGLGPGQPLRFAVSAERPATVSVLVVSNDGVVTVVSGGLELRAGVPVRVVTGMAAEVAKSPYRVRVVATAPRWGLPCSATCDQHLARLRKRARAQPRATLDAMLEVDRNPVPERLRPQRVVARAGCVTGAPAALRGRIEALQRLIGDGGLRVLSASPSPNERAPHVIVETDRDGFVTLLWQRSDGTVALPFRNVPVVARRPTELTVEARELDTAGQDHYIVLFTKVALSPACPATQSLTTMFAEALRQPHTAIAETAVRRSVHESRPDAYVSSDLAPAVPFAPNLCGWLDAPALRARVLALAGRGRARALPLHAAKVLEYGSPVEVYTRSTRDAYLTWFWVGAEGAVHISVSTSPVPAGKIVALQLNAVIVPPFGVEHWRIVATRERPWVVCKRSTDTVEAWLRGLRRRPHAIGRHVLKSVPAPTPTLPE